MHTVLIILLFCLSLSAEAQLADDLKVMVEAEVIESTPLWLEQCREGSFCDGQKVAGVIVRLAVVFEPTSDLAQALVILEKRKIIWNDYWAKHAVEGQKCEGRYLANLFHAASEPVSSLVLLKKYGVQEGVLSVDEPSIFAGTDFNYVIGTQTIGATYQFTKETQLVEAAEVIRAMGSSVLKFELSARYADKNGNVRTKVPAINSLAALARDEPSHRRVLDMPFSIFVMWAQTFHGGHEKWSKGFSKEFAEKEYREMYDLTVHLLKTYNGSGKTFLLGHWEGDGLLRHSIAKENDVRVTDAAVQGMTDWLNVRQRAVDDAKRDTPHEMVKVWHYTEVNHVKLAMQGRPALVNRVLPKTNVDLVSYSAYDTQGDPALFKAALSFIEQHLSPKPGMAGRRVFVGEYGFPAVSHLPAEQDQLSRKVMCAGLEWGCPLILYWELYNNEIDADGSQRGYWMIDDKGVKLQVFETHVSFYKWGREEVRKSNPPPSSEQFREAAVRRLQFPGKEDTLRH
jgi:hypothetical protein